VRTVEWVSGAILSRQARFELASWGADPSCPRGHGEIATNPRVPCWRGTVPRLVGGKVEGGGAGGCSRGPPIWTAHPALNRGSDPRGEAIPKGTPPPHRSLGEARGCFHVVFLYRDRGDRRSRPSGSGGREMAKLLRPAPSSSCFTLFSSFDIVRISYRSVLLVSCRHCFATFESCPFSQETQRDRLALFHWRVKLQATEDDQKMYKACVEIVLKGSLTCGWIPGPLANRDT
jgi:hypothetical protein